MQSSYPTAFVRDMACTESEWLGWLPRAMGDAAWRHEAGTACVQVALGAGQLRIDWSPLPPRVIALMRMPRLQVSFCFDQVNDDLRTAFMRRFDLHTQRGGG